MRTKNGNLSGAGKNALVTGQDCGRRRIHFHCMKNRAIHHFADYIVRTGFRLLVDTTYVFADDSQEEQVDAEEKCDRQNECREALRRVQPKLGI
jgi:hypothetical protein